MGAFGTAMNWLSASPSTEWPFCGPIGVLYRLPETICRMTEISAHLLIRAPPDFEKLTQEHPCPNPGGLLPLPLEEMNVCVDGGDGGDGGGGVRRKEMPMMIPAEVIAREKATYGWYLTHVYNVYSYVFKYADDLFAAAAKGEPTNNYGRYYTQRPIVPEGWGNQNVYFVKDPQGWKWPIGQSVTKDTHIVIFFRGTMFPGNWETDFTLTYANKTTTEARGLPGRIHKGFFDFVNQFFEEIEREVKRHNITKITYAGHSLGGAISEIAAAFMAVQREKDTHTQTQPALKINCVVFGSPSVGNREFTDYLNRNVNLRRIAYLGSGQKDIPEEYGLNYGFGDVATQMPLSCYNLSMPYCPGLLFLENTEGQPEYQFVMAAGNVPFYASDMPNTKRWLKEENYVFGSSSLRDLVMRGLACHICAYPCWLSAATGDDDTRCYFPGDPGANLTSLCDIEFIESMTSRYPALEGPPIDGDLVHEGAVAEGGGCASSFFAKGEGGGMLGGVWKPWKSGRLRKN